MRTASAAIQKQTVYLDPREQRATSLHRSPRGRPVTRWNRPLATTLLAAAADGGVQSISIVVGEIVADDTRPQIEDGSVGEVGRLR